METMEQLYTVSDVAKRLRVSKPTVYHWFNEGLLPFVWVGGRRRVKESDVLAFVRPSDAGPGEAYTEGSPSGQQSARVAA